MIMMMMMTMTMMTNTIPYRRTKTHIWDKVLMGFLVHPAPTVILNIVGHSSNYFKEFFFEAVISLNVTAMLVLTTMFINVSNNLPKTAYIKMIDIWLLFNLIKPFNDILVTTYMDSLKVDDEREINHHGVARVVGNEENGGPTVGVIQVAPLSRTTSADK